MPVGPFRFRDAATYWQARPAQAFLVDAVLGGAPGYRDVVGDGPRRTPEGYAEWLSRTLLNPSHALFAELMRHFRFPQPAEDSGDETVLLRRRDRSRPRPPSPRSHLS